MTTSDGLLRHYYSLNPAEFGFLECLELRQSVEPDDWSGFTLAIRLRASARRGADCLCLEFSGVQNLRIGPLEGLLRYFFEIRSVADRQLEDIKYEVVESEYKAFSFCCSGFSAQKVIAEEESAMLQRDGT
jgi:hypothetical protein